MNRFYSKGLALWVFILAQGYSQAQSKGPDLLQQNFITPNQAARPRVWWHWMNGNISKGGIHKDLLWMHRSGIGGFQNFDAGMITPQIVTKRLSYMTPEWKDAFRYATRLADSLKLEMAIAGSPGWSESGGPWVTAKDGMKKLVWREMRVKGGQSLSVNLPKPPATTGDFQNVPLSAQSSGLSEKPPTPPEYYEDIAVVAYRLPAADISLTELNPTITTNDGSFTLEQLTDGDLATTNLLPRDSVAGYGWIQFAFAQPQTIKGVSVVGGGTRSAFGITIQTKDRSLEASDDGVNFRRIAFIPLGIIAQQTITIPPTRAKYFRVTFKNPSAAPGFGAMMGASRQAPKPPAGTSIAEVVLHPVTRINHFEEKAGFATATDLASHLTPASADIIAERDVIDLTGKLNADGALNWTAPDGNWKIVRFGYSLTGKQNHPASREATGLEVDKLDGRAIRDYFTTYLNQYKDATGGLMGARGLQYIVTDSYESGQNNWTPLMAQEFAKRRGYELLPWMPVLTGQVVKSTEASEKFLWDYRKTIAELIVENHYDQLTTILAKYGMKRYSESHENGRVFIMDGMDVKRTAAVPMSAMWTPGPGGSSLTMAQADIRESASVSHLYGQNLVAGESLTSIGFGGNAWAYSPERLKPTADLEMANGLNRFVIHTSVHQPVDDKIPGLSLAIFGQWFNRHDTWAEQAKAWTDYLARSSYLLQQGKFVADVAYYYGEDNNITGLFGAKLPDIPTGYNYDFVNPHALINLLSVKNGKLVTPSGMSYRMMHLDSNARNMSLPVLRKIAHLVKNGAVISGVRPENSPGMNDDPQEFTRLVTEVWGSNKPNVHTGKTVTEVLNALHIVPDFEYTKPQATTQLLYVHRKVADGDVYWVNNRSDLLETLKVTFRVSGKVPQIWHPETGRMEAASYRIADGRTTVPLHLAPNDAVFVVFRTSTTQMSVTLPEVTEKEVATLEGSWNVTFQSNRGAPRESTFDKLASYTENPDAGIKYFSGTATYTKAITLPVTANGKGVELWLDLGEVKNLAEVIVNGKSMGIVWKKPFRVNVSNTLKPGENKLEVNVTNLWVNRLIGDAQPGVTNKLTYVTMPFYQANSPLQSSGLLGPVKLLSR
ncbi:glycosyl hydrolase [Spirosoma endbachense]|uniref:Glycoside hydrolase n=1 Tax=Spirosoma endbachense TaxID=2666025 RepID=A0A6P1W9L7_9BACT|nr:glycosyl hydrolase [Spirosoma endbachense]QHW00427.1 glycoside hydrolase [Spirosoma endbachense]